MFTNQRIRRFYLVGQGVTVTRWMEMSKDEEVIQPRQHLKIILDRLMKGS